jgi:hypothetical protein
VSFDVMLLRVRLDGTFETRRDVFTGEMRTFPRSEPLSTAEHDAVLAVLARAGVSEPDALGVRHLRLPDGASATVHTRDLSTGCSFFLRGHLTRAMVEILHDVMVAGRWVLMADGASAAPSSACVEGADPDIAAVVGEIVIVTSAEGLAARLAGPFGAWSAYRDHVVATDDDDA